MVLLARHRLLSNSEVEWAIPGQTLGDTTFELRAHFSDPSRSTRIGTSPKLAPQTHPTHGRTMTNRPRPTSQGEKSDDGREPTANFRAYFRTALVWGGVWT